MSSGDAETAPAADTLVAPKTSGSAVSSQTGEVIISQYRFPEWCFHRRREDKSPAADIEMNLDAKRT